MASQYNSAFYRVKPGAASGTSAKDKPRPAARRTRRVVSKFPSLKMGRMVPATTALACDLLYLLEFDREVESYREDPDYYYCHGADRIRFDFIVRRARKTQLALVLRAKDTPFDERLQYRVGQSCRSEGLEFVVYDERFIRAQPRLYNIKLLFKYARLPIEPDHQIACFSFFQNSPETTLGALLGHFASEGLDPILVYTLIYHGFVFFDLMQLLDSQTVLRLPTGAALPAGKEARA
jgi:hypothetical protein